MPRLKLTLAYQGTHYSGWQMQRPASVYGAKPSVKKDTGPSNTIQEHLERIFMRIAGVRLPVHGAGRTDAGVHAEGQVCHVDIPESKTAVDWKKALNAYLPYDIRITGTEWVPGTFHSRRSARVKCYAYSIWTGKELALPRIKDFVWSAPSLDLSLMMKALPYLVGRHDFASFKNSGTRVVNTQKTIFTIDCMAGKVAGLSCPPEWPVMTFYFTGDGFLKQMVRNIAGLLVAIGQGKIDCSEIPEIIAAKDRKALQSACAPPQGLTLMEVLY